MIPEVADSTYCDRGYQTMVSEPCVCQTMSVLVSIGLDRGKRSLERPRRGWEDNIKMYLKEIGIDRANWIRLAQDRVQWRAFVNTVMNLRLP
jgi:hypothetical protein